MRREEKGRGEEGGEERGGVGCGGSFLQGNYRVQGGWGVREKAVI